MSSGHGINTKQGRCYPFWTEVARCREEPDSTPQKCKNYVEDFMECLFHRKERNRLIKMIKSLEDPIKTTSSTTDEHEPNENTKEP